MTTTNPPQAGTLTVDQALQQAITRHRSGDLNGAEQLYRAILQVNPRHPDSNHNLGVLALQVDQPSVALTHFRIAFEAKPGHQQYGISYIDALIKTGKRDEARQMLEQAREQGLSHDKLALLTSRFDAMGSAAVRAEALAHAVQAPKEPAPEELSQLMTLFNQSRYTEVESLARDMTARFPDHGFGWKVLGAVYGQQGNIMASLLAMQKAVELLPMDSDVHSNLGNVLRDLRRLDEAEASYRMALQIRPDYAGAYYNLGATLGELGRLGEAEASYRRALEIKPDFAEAHNNLGATLRRLGRLGEAEASYRRALQINPAFAAAYKNLGKTLKELKRLDEAEASFRRALQIKPADPEACNLLGATCGELGRLDEAEASYRQALQIKPEFAEAYNNLGATLRKLGRLDEAEASYRRALQIKPGFAEAFSNLGATLRELGRLDEAEASHRRALEIKPDYAETHNNLGNVLRELGRLNEAEASYRRALEIKPDDAETYSNLLLTSNYMADKTPLSNLEEALLYGHMVSSKASNRFSTWNCLLQPSRLRVGLVSGDLRSHPVGHFLENVLAQLNRSSIELIAYSTNNMTDELTSRIKPYFSIWKSLAGKSDEAAASLIHADGVHVLLDLSGHTANNRLPVFAWKPAPVQTTWLGYFATTGVAGMDYLLGDPYVTPDVEAVHYTETIWRLPESYLCFTPPDIPLEVERLPALSAHGITFGCFNNLAKMNDAVVALWAKVLQAVPNSRLFLKTKQLTSPAVHDTTLRRFAAQGIPPDRLLLEGYSPRAELLTAYNRVDIALDPFPYPGGTTSVEGLWMGVPVITRSGDRFLSHIGESIAHNAGLSEWISSSDDDYVARAVAQTGDLDKLAALRSGLRQQLLASPLFDAERYAGNLESALWRMWERWRNEQTD